MSLKQKRVIALLLIDAALAGEPRKRRKYWCKNWLLEKQKYGDMKLLKELKENNPEDYKNYLRMDNETFTYLLEKVRPKIERKDTVMRKAITVEQRLVTTLRYLATGRSLQDLKFSAVISPQLLGNLIPETCRAIYDVLKDEYIKMPSTEAEWQKVAQEFNEQWNFPNCGGAVDGKHLAIVKPPNSGSYFYNYKGFYSVVLLAVVDANLNFLMADVGQNGRVSDGGVIDNTIFYKRLQRSTLGLPQPEHTKGGLNFVFIGDEAFALKETFLKPYPQKHLTYDRRIFNYRLSRARRTVENAFGILSNVFRIFHTTITLEPEKVEDITLACVVLHNFLRRRCKATYAPSTMIDHDDSVTGEVIEGEWRKQNLPTNSFQDLKRGKQRNPSDKAKDNRDAYMRYFTTIGQVPWQDKLITAS